VRIGRDELLSLNQRFAHASPESILEFTHQHFGKQAAILSSMQRAGTLLCHWANHHGLAFDVLFVDTGVLHTETLATRDQLQATHRHLNVITLAPSRSFADQCHEEGVLYLSKEGQERCCDLRKSDPLRSVKGHYHALLGALRRSEGGARSKVEVFDLDTEMNALRIHPFAHLTSESLAAYQEKHADIVVNPLHFMGFPTIGCFPCTTPVLPEESERAGRWRHLAGVTYCGINPVDRHEVQQAVELPDTYRSLFEEILNFTKDIVHGSHEKPSRR
jgi:phosphoadenosine phosphosulfate reductase